MKRICVFTVAVVIILFAEYFIGNWIGYMFEDSSTLSILNSFLSSPLSEEEDGTVYFNVCYDKQLVAVKDEMGDSIENEVITDRRTLIDLLDIAEISDYKFLFLDIRFEKGLESNLDSILFSKIKSMRDIIILTHNDGVEYEIANIGLKEKAGYADYLSTFFSGFTKYSYLQNDSVSVALKLSRNMNGGDIIRIGQLFFSDYQLCNNMQFLTFKESDIINSNDVISQSPALGGVILSMLDEDEIANLMKDRIVVVGDMNHDVHATYAGDVFGPVHNIRAFEALVSGKHLIKWNLVLSLFLVYGFCAYIILFAHTKKISDNVKKILYNHPLILFLLLNIGWSIVMFFVKIIAFSIFGASVIIDTPAFIFSLISMPESYSEFKSNKAISYTPKNFFK